MATKTTTTTKPSLHTGRYTERQQQINTRGNFGRFQDGKTAIRIFTFEHTVTERDFELHIYERKSPNAPKIGDRVREIDRMVVKHFLDDGVIVCSGKGCDVCREARELSQSRGKQDQKYGKSISGRKQFVVNAVDIGDVEAGMREWSLPQMVYNDVLALVIGGEIAEDDLFGCRGRDIVVQRNSKLPPAQMYKSIVRDAAKCEELPAELDDAVKDLNENVALDPGVQHVEKEDDDPRPRRSSARAEADDEDEPTTRTESRRSAKPVNDEAFADDDPKPQAETEDDAPTGRSKADPDEEPAVKVDDKPKARKKPKDEDKPRVAKPKKGDVVRFRADSKTHRATVLSEKNGTLVVKDESDEEWELQVDDLIS